MLRHILFMDLSPLTDTTTEWLRSPRHMDTPQPLSDLHGSPQVKPYTYGSLTEDLIFVPFEVGTCCGYPISQMPMRSVSPIIEKENSPALPNPYTAGMFAISMALPPPWFYKHESIGRSQSCAATECVEPSVPKIGN